MATNRTVSYLGWRWLGTAAALSAIVLAPAAFRADDRPVFSHATHLGEGLGCDSCHKQGEDAPAGALDTSGCTDCHDEGAPGTALAAASRPLRAPFPHARHVDAAECKDCHQPTMSDAQPNGEPLLPVGRCFECHQENGVETPETACASCHGVDQRRVRPADHAQAWRERHGRESMWSEVAGHGQACGLCHADSACRACHTQTRPRSHTGLWRWRVHGTAASFDRDTCRTCHETGTCISCHQRTEPLNHRGAWRTTHGLVAGGRSDAGCTTCHGPAYCAECHGRGSR